MIGVKGPKANPLGMFSADAEDVLVDGATTRPSSVALLHLVADRTSPFLEHALESIHGQWLNRGH